MIDNQIRNHLLRTIAVLWVSEILISLPVFWSHAPWSWIWVGISYIFFVAIIFVAIRSIVLRRRAQREFESREIEHVNQLAAKLEAIMVARWTQRANPTPTPISVDLEKHR